MKKWGFLILMLEICVAPLC